MTTYPYRWVIADGYLPEASQGALISHESVCVLNLEAVDAHLELTLYFETAPPQSGYFCLCPSLRCHHIRLDALTNVKGQSIPRGRPYAIVVSSDVDLIVQHTRLDSSQPALALMTTMAHPLPSP
jgi:hypothetical protein